MKLGICEWCIPVEETPRRIQWASEVGLFGLEIDLGNCGDLSSISEMAEATGIAIPTLGVNLCCSRSMCKPVDSNAIKEAFAEAVITANQLKIPKLQVPSFCASWIEHDADLEQTADNLRYACKLAEETGLIVGTENALNGPQQLQLLEMVGSSQLKIYFDTRNAFSMQGYNSANILQQLLPHVCEVHIKDGLNDGPPCPLGAGNAGFHECMQLLHHSPYSGWYLLENDYTSMEQCQHDIQTALAYGNR